jgi:membrane dipeptidase
MEQNLKIVRNSQDVLSALAGVPHVVLSVEGATFAERGIDQFQAAYDLGIRHIQLVHLLKNAIGDIQTDTPEHDGLSAYGRDVVFECNRLGILVDLAHCTDNAVMQALAISKAPMVWSHSSVQRAGMPLSVPTAWRARQLSQPAAKALAARGGVVGLWALGADVGPSVEGYADRIVALADILGEDHVAFGSDMNALANPAIASYSDLRRVVQSLQRRGVRETQIRKIAIENYARVLRAAMHARES